MLNEQRKNFHGIRPHHELVMFCAYVLSNAAQFFYGPNYTGIGAVLPAKVLFLNWPEKSLIVILATVPLLVVLTYIVRFTRQAHGLLNARSRRVVGLAVTGCW